MILENIEDALLVLGTKCNDCLELRGKYEIYQKAERKDNTAVFKCGFGDSYKANVNFFTSLKDFDKLEKELNTIDKKLRYNDRSVYQKKLFIEDYSNFFKKLMVYAEFSPDSFEKSFHGYCRYCLKESELSIRKRKVWIVCSVCAGIIADSMD